MKWRSRFFIGFLVCSLLGIGAIQAKDFDFRLNLKKGEKFDYVFTSSDKVDQIMNNLPAKIEQQSSLTFSLTVLGKIKGGGYKLAADYKKFSTHIVMNGNKIDYDSDSVYQSNPYADLLNDFNKIHYTFDLSATGVVGNIQGLGPWTQKINSNIQLANLLKGVGTEEFISVLLNYLPQTSVQPGAKWTISTVLPEMKNLKYNMNYHFEGAGADQITLGLEAKIDYKKPKAEGDNISMTNTISQRGRMLLDPKSFMPVSCQISQTSDLAVTNTNPRTLVETTTPMKIKTEKSLKLVPPVRK